MISGYYGSYQQVISYIAILVRLVNGVSRTTRLGTSRLCPYARTFVGERTLYEVCKTLYAWMCVALT